MVFSVDEDTIYLVKKHWIGVLMTDELNIYARVSVRNHSKKWFDM